jgi:hypothetical protein
MNKRDWFGLIIRLFGVWYFTQGLYFAFLGFIKDAGLDPNTQYPAPMEGAVSIFYLLLGVGLVCCAEFIVWMVYRVPPKPTPPDAASTRSTSD